MSESGYVKVATKNQISEGAMIKVHVDDEEVLLVNVGGGFYALANKCPHMHGDLSAGKLDGEVVTCPRHGSKFNVTTGEAVGKPKMGLFHPKVNDAKVFEVKVDGEDILVKR